MILVMALVTELALLAPLVEAMVVAAMDLQGIMGLWATEAVVVAEKAAA